MPVLLRSGDVAPHREERPDWRMDLSVLVVERTQVAEVGDGVMGKREVSHVNSVRPSACVVIANGTRPIEESK